MTKDVMVDFDRQMESEIRSISGSYWCSRAGEGGMILEESREAHRLMAVLLDCHKTVAVGPQSPDC